MLREYTQPGVATASRSSDWNPARSRGYCGDGRDILLQAFHWASHLGGGDSKGQRKSWYRVLVENAETIRDTGFTRLWMPPPSDSLAPQGYIPRRWNVLDSAYGSEADLRDALRALHPVEAIADVVINHRVGVATSGADFLDPPFPDNRAAITRDDDSGIGTGAFDTGESHPAGRDLDHTNPGVRETIKGYLQRLASVGFTGWRYDLVKGYHGRFVAEYNDASEPAFSVGEFYDGDRQKVTDWIDSTHGKSAAFDFPTRYLLYDACRSDDFSRLCSWHHGKGIPAGLIGFWPERAVTFVDNHDTEYRRDEEHQCHNDGTRHFAGRTVDMGYAYLLTHPGVPCVFWSHFFDWGEPTRRRIQQLIHLRKRTGLHAGSWIDVKESSRGLYAAIVDGKLAVKLGSRGWCPGGGWHHALEGDGFSVWKRCD